MTERRAVSHGQQRVSLTLELDACGVADGKDASKAWDDAMLGHEPSHRAGADARRQELPARHPAPLESGDLGYPVLD